MVDFLNKMNLESGRSKDIDILRAIAVLLVIGYHYFPRYIELGYLGVDIFLVISGYLMVASYNSSETAIHFLKKRVYRLMPALLSVALICFILMVVVLRKDSLYDYSKELITSIAGISNFYYYSKLGYFDSGSQDNLFLMSWTLSLEIQYYFLIALSFGLIIRRILPVLVLISLSIGSSFFLGDSAAFYLISSRLWEFLAGVLLYLYLTEKGEKKEKLIFIFLAIPFVIFGSIHYFLIDSYTVLLQLAAVSLAVLVISGIIKFNFKSNNVRKVFLWIGASSYSLYLVHWPILFFARGLSLESSAISVIISLILVFVLAKLNFVYVECKLTKYLKNNNLLGLLIIIFLIPMVIFSLNKRAELIENAKIELSSVKCDLDFANYNEVTEYCRKFGSGDGKKIVLWGDSHISRIARPIINSLSNHDSLYLISHNACPPLVEIAYINRDALKDPCNDINIGSKVASYINKLDADVVIMASRWPMYFDGYLDNLDLEFLVTSSTTDGTALDINFSKSVNATVQKINSNNIIIIIPPLELVKKINFRPQYVPKGDYFSTLSKEFDLSIKRVKEIEKPLFLDLKEVFCRPDSCFFSDSLEHYYDDDNHLSDHGSDYAFSFLRPKLLKIIYD